MTAMQHHLHAAVHQNKPGGGKKKTAIAFVANII